MRVNGNHRLNGNLFAGATQLTRASQRPALSHGGASYGKGLGSLAAEPRSPAPKTWEYEPSTVAEIGQIPETPPGGADGVWIGSVGGDAAKARDGTAGIGGDVLSTSRLTI